VKIRGKIECSFKPDDKLLATLIFFAHQPEASAEGTAMDIHDGMFDGRADLVPLELMIRTRPMLPDRM
jgi:hypothetical protein